MKCPVCLNEVQPKLVETHIDTIENKEYKIYSCPNCEVGFSEPMRNPGPEYYQKFTDLWGYRGKSVLLPNWRLKHLKMLCKTNPKPLKLLDVGCGYGDFLFEAQKVGCQVTGIDFDEEKVKIAKKKGIKNVYVTDFDNFYKEAKTEKFDIITFFELLEHMENPNRFIDMVSDLLSPGGYIMLDVPNNQRVLKSASGVIDYPPHHLTRWTPKALLNFIRKKNFEIITTTTIYPIMFLYDNLFTLLSMTFLGVVKKVLFKRKSIHELRTTPLEYYFAQEISSRNLFLFFLKNRKIRKSILEIIKFFYYLVIIPTTILPVFPLLAYLRKKDRGLFIFLVAKKTNEDCN
jgi:2-polyprenyl-3-methyl-5-hydroxy-6-metoxy-1,4-benzoquinol methylase